MYNTSIPTADDLNPSWFSNLLHSCSELAGDISVSNVALERIGAEESMMSTLFAADLTYDGHTDAPSRLIVKLTSPSETQRFIAGLFRFYEREIRFYHEFATEMPIAIPKSFAAQIHPEEPVFVLVLEDVGGRRAVDQLEGLGLDDTNTAVDALADMHAQFWGRDLSAVADTFLPFASDGMKLVIPDAFANDWRALREQMLDVMPAEVIDVCDRFTEIAPEVLDAMGGPDTLIHGDFRADNLLFDDTILVLDFQLAAIANGAVDLAYLVSQSVGDEIAAAHGDEFMTRYLGRLAMHDIVLDRATADTAYAGALIFFLQIPMGMMVNPDLPERSKALALSCLRRASAEIIRTGAQRRFGSKS